MWLNVYNMLQRVQSCDDFEWSKFFSASQFVVMQGDVIVPITISKWSVSNRSIR